MAVVKKKAVKVPVKRKIGLVITNRQITDLKNADYNPRKIAEKDFKQLKASLISFDAVEPAIININPKRKNIIIGGHQRIAAAKELGWTTFPCIEINLSLKKERELNLRLNKNTGEWDWAKLGEFELEDLKNIGFNESELKNLDIGEIEIDSPVFEKPESEKSSITITFLKSDCDNIKAELEKIKRNYKNVVFYE